MIANKPPVQATRKLVAWWARGCGLLAGLAPPHAFTLTGWHTGHALACSGMQTANACFLGHSMGIEIYKYQPLPRMFRAPKPSKENKQKPQSFPLNMSNRLQHGRTETTLIHAYMCMCTEGESMFKHGGEILFL